MVLVVLSPDSPFPFRISGSPATFIERILKVPEAADALVFNPKVGIARQSSPPWVRKKADATATSMLKTEMEEMRRAQGDQRLLARRLKRKPTLNKLFIPVTSFGRQLPIRCRQNFEHTRARSYLVLERSTNRKLRTHTQIWELQETAGATSLLSTLPESLSD